jgi:sugar phosphate permease
LAFLYFIYGIVKFVNPNTGEKDKVDARNSILWGLVGMAIMFSVYGLISFVLSTFGIKPNTTVNGQPVEPTKFINEKLNGN